MPCPKPTCCTVDGRSMSNSSGRSHTRSSRLADPRSSNTFAPSGIRSPCSSTGAGQRARHELRRAFVAQDLLDRVGDPRRVGRDLGALGREALQREQAVGEQLRGGLVARDDQQEQEPDHLVVAQALAAGDRAAAQRGREVVGRVAGRDRGAAVGDEVAEVLEEVGGGLDAGGRDVGHAFVAVEQRVGPVAQLLLVGLGHAEHARDHVHRQARRVVGDEVAVALRDEPVEELPWRGARTSGSRSATRRGVNARLTSRRRSVCAGGSVVSSIGSGLSCSSVMP